MRAGWQRRRVLAALLGFGAATPFTASGQSEAAPELRLSAAVGPALPLGRVAERWAQLIAGRAGGAFTVKFHPGATLAQRDAGREFIALRDGAADLAVGSALAWSAQVPALAVVALPWLAPDRSSLDALLGDADLRGAVADSVAAAGAVMLAWGPLGHRDLAARHAVRTPGDLQGLRVRMTPNPLLVDLYASLRMVPSSMSFGEAQAAFASGVLDAQEGPGTALAALRVGELGLGHVVEWGAVADAMVFAVRPAVWQRFTEAQRDAVRDAAAGAMREAAVAEREEAALKALAGVGVEVARLTPAGRAPFAVASRAVYERWRATIGADLVRQAERAVEAGASPTPRAR